MQEHEENESQNEFVEWLKKHQIYSEFDTAATMRKAHRVWEITKAETELSSESACSLADVIPTTWLDPLLTGPDKALTGEPGKWGCPDIENLLSAIKARIENAEGK